MNKMTKVHRSKPKKPPFKTTITKMIIHNTSQLVLHFLGLGVSWQPQLQSQFIPFNISSNIFDLLKIFLCSDNQRAVLW